LGLKADAQKPSATGKDWQTYKKDFADDEIEEKKITPLTDECDTLKPSIMSPLLNCVSAEISKYSKVMVWHLMEQLSRNWNSRSKRSNRA
jgi:hypothetical protein